MPMKPGANRKPRTCKFCSTEYTPDGNTQQVCKVCIPDEMSWFRYRKYKLTAPQLQDLVDRFTGNCWCCGEFMVRINVDHCHKTGKVRGILCCACNTGIGYIEKSQGWLGKALTYLEKSNA